MAKFLRQAVLTAFALLSPAAVRADPARFDLAGPKVDIRVTRAGKTLPIASVPNLAPGDKLWVRPDLPPTQSVRYLMVVAFLRGTTNPPPDDWFIRIETWDKKVREEGVEVTIPAEAQQALVFLAPVTGGDFSTLRSAVRGRPGVFVRASQDLNEAGFEQGRIERYLAAIREVPPGDPKALLDHSNALARTLALRPNPDCFKREPDQQVTCLTQTGTQTLLDDGHGQTIAQALTTGPGSDFITAASYTQAAGAGTYSAYVGAIVDLGRILSNLHTAQFQYIPAISFPQQEMLNLRLNTPPSFHSPKSVIVIGLPAIQKAVTPPLRVTDEKQTTCLVKPNATLPIDGAPLVFSTSFAHDLTLHLSDGSPQDLPLSADAYQGGLLLVQTPQRRLLPDPAPVQPLSPSRSGPLTGTVQGFWGFDPFTGPTVPLQASPAETWKILSGEPLIAGRDDHLVLASSGTACLQTITFNAPGAAPIPAVYKPAHQPETLEVALPLTAVPPGSLSLAIHQYGSPVPVNLAIRTYAEPAKVETITLHAGDRTARLTGQHLDQVRGLSIDDIPFTPTASSPSDTLPLVLPPTVVTPAFHPGDKLTAKATLADGRILDLPFAVSPARPILTLRSRSTPHDAASPIKLIASDDLRIDQPLTLILKSPSPIPRTQELELATQDTNPDATLSGRLTFASGALVLQDAHTLRATFDPLKLFGTSIFGPVRLRATELHADPGDWIPLATFVRLPTVNSLVCPADPAKPCLLAGASLYLIDAIASTPTLTDPTNVPEDYTDSTLAVPHPVAGLLYFHPRDDRAATATLALPIQPELVRPVATPRISSPPATR